MNYIMEIIMEFLLRLVVEPVLELILGVPLEVGEDYLRYSKLKKSVKILLAVIFGIEFTAAVLAFVYGAIWMIVEKDFYVGGITFGVGGGLLALHIISAVICARRKTKRKKTVAPSRPQDIIGKKVRVIIDRPINSVHPEHPDIVYGVNYGFIPEYTAADSEAQDAYVLGVEEKIDKFIGVVIAVIHRRNDVEDKWIVAPENFGEISDDEIKQKTNFCEKYFDIEILRR